MPEPQAPFRYGAAGNIVKQHFDEEGVLQYGSKAFTGRTKVYLAGMNWRPGDETVCVVGRNRFRRWVIESVPTALIENVRFTRIYKPTVLEILENAELMEGWHWWTRTSADRKAALAFVNAWNAALQNPSPRP